MRLSKINRDPEGRVILPKGVKLNHSNVEPSNLIATNADKLTNDGLFKAIVEQDDSFASEASDLDYGKQPEAGDESEAFAAQLPLRVYKVNPTEVQTLCSDAFRSRAVQAKEKKQSDDTAPVTSTVPDTSTGTED